MKQLFKKAVNINNDLFYQEFYKESANALKQLLFRKTCLL